MWSYAWARQGFDWDPGKLDHSISNIVQRLNTVAGEVRSNGARRALAEMTARLVDEHGKIRHLDELPTPRKLAALSTGDVPDLGKRVMLGSNWYGRKKL